MNYEDIEEDLFKEFGFPITSKNELNEETFSQILDYLGRTKRHFKNKWNKCNY